MHSKDDKLRNGAFRIKLSFHKNIPLLQAKVFKGLPHTFLFHSHSHGTIHFVWKDSFKNSTVDILIDFIIFSISPVREMVSGAKTQNKTDQTHVPFASRYCSRK